MPRLVISEMPPPRFNFPPESYSAVYTGDVPSANVVNSKIPGTEVESTFSPTSSLTTSPVSLFSCFHCAFSNNFKDIAKDRRRGKTGRESRGRFMRSLGGTLDKYSNLEEKPTRMPTPTDRLCTLCRVFGSDKRTRGRLVLTEVSIDVNESRDRTSIPTSADSKPTDEC